MLRNNNQQNVLTNKRFRLPPFTLGVLFVFSPWASAEDYFDSNFLGLAGDKNTVDLSAFSREGGVAEGDYTVSVFVNNESVGRYTLAFRNKTGKMITPQITPKLLEEWGVNVPNIPTLKTLPSDDPVGDLETVIPQFTSKLDLSRLRLDVSIPQVAMSPHYAGYADPSQWEEGISAMMANYSLSAGRTISRVNEQAANNNNLFASLRMGANTGPWRLRSNMTYAYSENGGEKNGVRQTQRNTGFSNTNLSRDIRPLRSSLLVGESQTGSEIFDGVPFKGVQLSSNEQMLPSQLQGFAPAISGVANSNARITVLQSGNIVYETFVAPGPFYINDIQQSGMSGDYDVKITETDGTVRRFTVPYSSLPVMLRPGGWKYEITGGRYDGNLTTSSRRADFLLGTAVYGLPQNITLFGGALIAHDYQAVSAGSGVSLGNIGALSADVTGSKARFNQDKTLTGQSYRVRYSKSLVSTGTSLDLTALRYSTEHYYTFDEFNGEGYRLEDGVSPWALQSRRSSFQTQVSQQMDQWGTVHLRFNRDDYWGLGKTQTGMSLGYSNNIKGVNVGVNYNIDRVKNDNNQWPENRQVSASVSVPFSVFGYKRDFQSMYATTSVTHDNTGRTRNYAGLSGNTLDGLLNYNMNQSWGNQGQAASSNANIGYQGSKGSVSSGYSYSSSTQSMNMNANGGLLVHSEGITLSRTLGDSVALVIAPKAPGVSVNGGAAVTDWRGYAVAPYLTDYGKNSIALDPTTLPAEIDLKQTNINVYPTKGAVMKATFATRVGYKVLVTLKHHQDAVPFGAIATLLNTKPDEEITGIVGDNGQVYLAGLPEMGQLQVKWGSKADQQCLTQFDLSKQVQGPDMVIRQLIVTCLSK